MKLKLYLLALGLFCFSTLAFANSPVFLHREIGPVVKGDKARLELNIMAFDNDIYEGRLFYKEAGETDYHSKQLKSEGFSLYTELETSKINPGEIQYYFAMQTVDGSVITYPENAPESEPFRFKLVAGSAKEVNQAQEEILVLSPEPDEVVSQDDILIAVSIPNTNADVDPARTRLLIDGVNVSSLMQRDGNLYTLIPEKMRTGTHNIEFKIFDPNGSVIGSTGWSFRATTGAVVSSGFKQRTNLFLDERYQNIAETSKNYFRGGLNWNASYNAWDFQLRTLLSSDDGYSSQSSNRFGAFIAYNFTPLTRLYLKGGDFSGDYDFLTFWNRRVLGFGIGLNSKWVDFDLSIGQTAKAVEGSAVGDSITTFGTYKEKFFASRLAFNFGNHATWGFNLINGKQDTSSIKYGANPRESVVFGTSLKLNFDNNRVRFKGSVQASIANSDARGEVSFDSLTSALDISESDKNAAKPFVNFFKSTGLLTISQGLAPLPVLAMNFETQLNYFNNNLILAYKSIDPNYVTPGNPYLLRGIRGFFATDNIRMIENQVFLNLYLRSYKDNLSQQDAETNNLDLGASVSYFPAPSIPSLTVSFGNQSRKNNADINNASLYPENNSTQRIGASTSYSFLAGSVNNTATFSVSTINRDDKITRTIATPGDTSMYSNNSEFTVYSLAFKNQFDFPLLTRFGFSQSNSLFGKGAANELNSDILQVSGGLEYLFKGIGRDIDFKPFVNVSVQTISSKTTSDYNRKNYSAGFYINSLRLGNLSLRYDYIDYEQTWKDSIFSTRYDLVF